MGKKREIEIKLPLINYEELIGELDKSASFKFESRQVDKYFNPPHVDFAANLDNISEWLRLRISNGKYSINYKGWHPKDTPIKTHCDEYETEISSIDDFELILKATGFSPSVTVDKIRRVYDLKDVEISIDMVKELGGFIEIEYKGDEEDVMKVRDYLFEVLNSLGAKTGELDKRGYPWELLVRRKAKTA